MKWGPPHPCPLSQEPRFPLTHLSPPFIPWTPTAKFSLLSFRCEPRGGGSQLSLQWGHPALPIPASAILPLLSVLGWAHFLLLRAPPPPAWSTPPWNDSLGKTRLVHRTPLQTLSRPPPLLLPHAPHAPHPAPSWRFPARAPPIASPLPPLSPCGPIPSAPQGLPCALPSDPSILQHKHSPRLPSGAHAHRGAHSGAPAPLPLPGSPAPPIPARCPHLASPHRAFAAIASILGLAHWAIPRGGGASPPSRVSPGLPRVPAPRPLTSSKDAVESAQLPPLPGSRASSSRGRLPGAAPPPALLCPLSRIPGQHLRCLPARGPEAPSSIHTGNPRAKAWWKVRRIGTPLGETRLGPRPPGWAASAEPGLPLPPLPPSLPSPLAFSLPFFLEGQVVTFYCLLATASTAPSNRRTGCGPHQDGRGESSWGSHSTPGLGTGTREGEERRGGTGAGAQVGGAKAGISGEEAEFRPKGETGF